MQLRYLIYIILFLVTSFILNIFFYFISADYRSFLRSIKADNIESSKINNVDNIDNIYIDTEENIKNNEILKEANNQVEDSKLITKEIISDAENKNNDLKEIKVEYTTIIWEVKETKIEQDFLNRFKEYKLKKLELHPRLFDLTTEYPDEYIEYYSEYLTIYLFGNKSYDSLKDIFKVLTYELPFTINEVNNFWDKSFYINLDNEFQDNQIRIVLLYKNRTFGLKMSKDVYPMIRDKLARLK